MSLKTNKKPAWLQVFPFHPFLFAIYPILALLAFNISEVNISSGWRPLWFSVIAMGLLVLAFYAIFRDWKRAALLSTIILILFYSYGHVYILLKGVNIGGVFFFFTYTILSLCVGFA